MDKPLRPATDAPMRSAVNRRLRDYWLEIGGGAPPAWRAFDPSAVTALLPHLIVVDAEGDPYRFRFRLIGTAVTQLAGRDATGRWLDRDLYGDRLDHMTWHYRQCAETAEPLAIIGTIHFVDKEWVTAEHIFLPFASEGRVDKILCGLHVLDGDTRREGKERDLEEVLDWRS